MPVARGPQMNARSAVLVGLTGVMIALVLGGGVLFLANQGGDVEIRLRARTVHIGRTHVAVSPKEFELITFFARNAGEVVTRMQLLENVWNLHFDPQTNVVETHISRLRAKVDKPFQRDLIVTVRGAGYRIDG